MKLKVEREMQGTPAPRNRAERRRYIAAMPRQFTKNVHGFGQWSKKVIKNGELTRP